MAAPDEEDEQEERIRVVSRMTSLAFKAIIRRHFLEEVLIGPFVARAMAGSCRVVSRNSSSSSSSGSLLLETPPDPHSSGTLLAVLLREDNTCSKNLPPATTRVVLTPPAGVHDVPASDPASATTTQRSLSALLDRQVVLEARGEERQGKLRSACPDPTSPDCGWFWRRNATARRSRLKEKKAYRLQELEEATALGQLWGSKMVSACVPA